jgi:hypothetical protein
MIETGGVLETIEDDRGAVTIGWLQRKVLYARFEGELSVELGVAHLTRMRELLGSVSALRYFSDASKLSAYDLLARSDFVRFILVHKHRFVQYVTLTWGDSQSASSTAFASAIGEPIEILTDRQLFEQKLFRVAPHGPKKLQDNVRVRTFREVLGDSDRQRL